MPLRYVTWTLKKPVSPSFSFVVTLNLFVSPFSSLVYFSFSHLTTQNFVSSLWPCYFNCVMAMRVMHKPPFVAKKNLNPTLNHYNAPLPHKTLATSNPSNMPFPQPKLFHHKKSLNQTSKQVRPQEDHKAQEVSSTVEGETLICWSCLDNWVDFCKWSSCLHLNFDI